MTRWSVVAWAFVAAITGCAGAQVTSRAPEPPVHPMASCPPSFAAAQALEGGTYGASGQGADRAIESGPLLACPYPEGHCGYATETRPGGCSECYSSRTVFRCHSDRVPRPDGCPYTPPTAGERCAEGPLQCAYPEWASYGAVLADCVDERWERSEIQHQIPP